MYFDDPTVSGGWIAIIAVVAAATLHTIGVHTAARAQDLFVILKLLLIAGFIVFALRTFGDWQGTGTSGDAGASSWSPLAFANQLVWISFSYAGFNAAVYVAGEVTDAERNVPRALASGVPADS